MTRGTMEVIVVGARDLKKADLFGLIDPYVVIKYNNEEQRTTNTAQPKTSKSRMRRRLWLSGGRSAVWNEKFKFRVEYPVPGVQNQQPKLLLNIMDKDYITNDDDLGQATIYLKEVFELGLEKGRAELLPQQYRVVASDKTYQGEIEVGIIFTVNGGVAQHKYGGGGGRKR